MNYKGIRLKDYTKTREVIMNPKFYYGNETKYHPNTLYLIIPDKVRRELRLSIQNDYEFKVIICRKSETKEEIK